MSVDWRETVTVAAQALEQPDVPVVGDDVHESGTASDGRVEHGVARAASDNEAHPSPTVGKAAHVLDRQAELFAANSHPDEALIPASPGMLAPLERFEVAGLQLENLHVVPTVFDQRSPQSLFVSGD